MRDLKGKVAVITGAASGIGRGIARRCVQEGMRVVLADIEEPALEETRRELAVKGGQVVSVLTDVSKASDVENLARKALEVFGAVHVLCNNAGVGAGRTIWESSIADWEWVLGVNLWGVIHGIRVFVPIMLAQEAEGHIVNTASVAGLLGSHPHPTYQVTKHAVVALSEHLYQSLKQRNARIGASVLCPGFVQTRILGSARNRPESLREEPAEATAGPITEEERWAGIWRQFRVISPEEAAGYVLDAVREDRFYIFTHPEFSDRIRERFDAILQARNPEPRPVSF